MGRRRTDDQDFVQSTWHKKVQQLGQGQRGFLLDQLLSARSSLYLVSAQTQLLSCHFPFGRDSGNAKP